MKTNKLEIQRIELMVVSAINTETGEQETITLQSHDEVMAFLSDVIAEYEAEQNESQVPDNSLN